MSALSLTIPLQQFVFQARRRLGTAGLVGVALLVAATIAAFAVPEEQKTAIALHDQAAHTRNRFDDLDKQLAATPSSGEKLERFQTWFPVLDRSTDDLRAVFDAARARKLDLPRGEYALTRLEGSGGLSRLDVVLPVKDSYDTVKAFVAAVLNALPHASLAELRVERPAAANDRLDARVHFALYYRER